MDKKHQLSNVAFGGKWSEDLLAMHDVHKIMTVIGRAVEECRDRDVFDDDLEESLNYIYTGIEKGPVLVAAFRKATKLPNPELRYQELTRIFAYMKKWSGL